MSVIPEIDYTVKGEKMLFVLAGPSYVGKKTALYHFVKLYSFSSIIPYTTKSATNRSGEVEGIHYHYIKDCNRNELENDETFIYDKPFYIHGKYQNNDLYAYRRTDIKNAIESHGNYIIHASVGNSIKIYKYFKNDNKDKIYIIFLRYESDLSELFFSSKCPSGLDAENFNKRFLHAQKEMRGYFDNKYAFDTMIQSDKTYEICDELEKYILPKLDVMPTSPDKIPGPLSDNDLLYTMKYRKNDRLEVSSNGKEVDENQFRNMLCGCGMHITLSEKIRRIRSSINGLIDMSMSRDDINKRLPKLFVEDNICNGYLLKPNETILCSSNESITIPHDLYAIIASKFSYSQLGLSIELGTSVIQSGHKGKVHFQIKNQTKNYIYIFPNIEVAQLLFFRTIQHHTTKESHNYDVYQEPPLPNFRENNSVLDNVKRKPSIFFNKLASLLENKILEAIGAIITIVIAGGVISKFGNYVERNIIPIIDQMSLMHKVLYLSIIVWLMNLLFRILGYAAKGLINFVRKLWINIMLNTDDNDND